MIKDIDEKKILNNSNLNNLFLEASLKDLGEKCRILKGDFYIDSFNYFPISSTYETFYFLFKRQDDNSINNFYSKDFYNNFMDKKNDFKLLENCFILGSSPSDNYFTNLIHFFPRIFFINDKKINLLIHRNLSNKFRKFIKSICEMREIEVNFSFVDDEFYNFKNSQIPQFFSIEKSIKVLRFFIDKLLPSIKTPNFSDKIYIRREDASYRKVLNEADLIYELRKKGFDVINPHHFEILEQMKIFSNAKLIISPHGSNLTNIIFCKKGTKVVEISPNFNESFETNIANRYKILSHITGLKFSKVFVDSVDVKKHSDIANKYINKKFLYESTYYKNLILKLKEIEELINNLQIDN